MIYNLSLIVLIAVTVWAMLTPKVKDKPGIIMALVCVAFGAMAIASVLNISEQTVKVHIRNLLRKLNVRSRVAATILFLQQRGAQ